MSTEEPGGDLPLYSWPEKGTPGLFRIGCSCGRFELTGDVDQINLAAMRHDDSPWHNHIVGIRARIAAESPVSSVPVGAGDPE